MGSAGVPFAVVWAAGEADSWQLINIELAALPPKNYRSQVLPKAVQQACDSIASSTALGTDSGALENILEHCVWPKIGPFQKQVLLTLATKVEPGQTISYGELAELAGKPRAAEQPVQPSVATPLRC